MGREGQWKPGESGNPNGRPKKGEALTDKLREKVDATELSEWLIKEAKSGDIQAIKYVFDRIEGKPRETVHQTIENLPEFVEMDYVDVDNTNAQDEGHAAAMGEREKV